MIEEDLFFPGKPLDDNDDVSTLNVDDVSILAHQTTSEEKTSSNPKLIAGDVPPRPQQDANTMISIHGKVQRNLPHFRFWLKDLWRTHPR